MNKFELACNPNTSADVLEKLAKDENFWVRYRVAYNSKTPPKVLEKLVNDKSSIVRFGVAYNPNTQKYIKLYQHYQRYLKCYGQNWISM